MARRPVDGMATLARAEPHNSANARFSNRPFGVKHFQTIHRCVSMSPTRSLCVGCFVCDEPDLCLANHDIGGVRDLWCSYIPAGVLPKLPRRGREHQRLLKIVQIKAADPRASSLIRAARDRNRRLGLGTGAFKVEAAIAHLDSIAAQQPQPLDATRGAGQGTVLRHGKDDSGRAGDEVGSCARNTWKHGADIDDPRSGWQLDRAVPPGLDRGQSVLS
jgi:hypothetical protein